jgi:hypothetical protein
MPCNLNRICRVLCGLQLCFWPMSKIGSEGAQNGIPLWPRRCTPRVRHFTMRFPCAGHAAHHARRTSQLLYSASALYKMDDRPPSLASSLLLARFSSLLALSRTQSVEPPWTAGQARYRLCPHRSRPPWPQPHAPPPSPRRSAPRAHARPSQNLPEPYGQASRPR